MKIVQLKAENIKRLTAVEITPDGSVIKISGKNAAGKTSVLDSIWWAMGGGEHIQDKPIRKGAEKGNITLDLGDLVVERRFTEKGTSLFVTNKDGARYPSPQKVLDHLVGKLTFDPLEFMRLAPKAQFEALRQIVNIGDDLDALDTKRKAAFDKRTMVNRQLKDKAGAVKANPVDPDAPDDVVPSGDIVAKIQKANEVNQAMKSIQDARARHYSGIEAHKQRIDELTSAIANEKRAIDDLQAKINEADKHLEGREIIDIEPLQADLSGLDVKNDAARNKQTAIVLHNELKKLEKESDSLTSRIKKVDADKMALLAETEFPTDGLSFADGAVMYNDLPLDQASSAEQLRVSMSIAMSANPDFRVIRITDGSLMDSDSFKLLEQMADENDYQIWVEVVDETGKVGIVIEDGAVVADNYSAEPKQEEAALDQPKA